MHQLLIAICATFQVRPVAEDEMFRVIRSGKRKSKYYPCSLFFSFSHRFLVTKFHFKYI